MKLKTFAVLAATVACAVFCFIILPIAFKSSGGEDLNRLFLLAYILCFVASMYLSLQFISYLFLSIGEKVYVKVVIGTFYFLLYKGYFVGAGVPQLLASGLGDGPSASIVFSIGTSDMQPHLIYLWCALIGSVTLIAFSYRYFLQATELQALKPPPTDSS